MMTTNFATSRAIAAGIADHTALPVGAGFGAHARFATAPRFAPQR